MKTVYYECPYCTDGTCKHCILMGQRHIRKNAGHVPEKSTPYADAIKWYNAAHETITAAGGHAPSIIDKFPDELLETLIRNHIYLDYRGPKP